MPASGPLSLPSVRTTSGQIALLLALNLHYKFFGEFTQDTFYTGNDIDTVKLDRFRVSLQYFLFVILSEESWKKICSKTIEPQGSTFTRAWQKLRALPEGKVNYFDENHKLILSDAGATELKHLLAALEIKDAGDIHVLNEFLPDKAVPLSARRIATTSSVFSAITALLLFGAFCGEDKFLPRLSDHFHTKVGIEDASSLTVSLLFSLFIAASTLRNIRQERAKTVVRHYTLSSVTALTTLKNFGHDINVDHYQAMFVGGNILDFKNRIASEASMQRSYYTLAASTACGVGFLLLDILTGGAFLGLRIGLGCVAAAITIGVRYAKKAEQNRTNLYAKVHRLWIASAFQKELQAELRVYGLQPVDEKVEISSDKVCVERQVSVDVSTFLGKNDDIVPKDSLKATKAWVKKNLPDEYKQHPQYFIEECLFQIRMGKGEDEFLVKAEREQLFAERAADFFARKQAKGIRYIHEHIMKYIARVEKEHVDNGNTEAYPWQKPYLYKNQAILPSDDEIHKKIHSDLGWNPLIAAQRVLMGKKEDVKQDIKRELSWTIGYSYYAASRFGVCPWKNDGKVLDAYYTKRYEAVDKQLIKKSHDKKDSKEIFEEMLKKDGEQSQEKTKKLGEKTLRQQHKDNMAGVGISSILSSGATVLLLAISPAFAMLPFLYESLSEIASHCVTAVMQSSIYFGASSFFKTYAVNLRRKYKKEARYQLPAAPA